MSSSQILVYVSIMLGIITIARTIRNATRAWDSIKDSIEKLYCSIDSLIVKKEQDHVIMNRRIDMLEEINAIRDEERRGKRPSNQHGDRPSSGNPHTPRR